MYAIKVFSTQIELLIIKEMTELTLTSTSASGTWSYFNQTLILSFLSPLCTCSVSPSLHSKQSQNSYVVILCLALQCLMCLTVLTGTSGCMDGATQRALTSVIVDASWIDQDMMSDGTQLTR